MSRTKQVKKDWKEDLWLIITASFMLGLLAMAIYVTVLRPTVAVWDDDGDQKIRVFDCVPKTSMTIVLSYGEGYKRFDGVIDLEIGAYYRITYMDKLGTVEKIISIEKVSK